MSGIRDLRIAIDARYSPGSGFDIEVSSGALVQLADALASEPGARCQLDTGARPSRGPEPYDEFVDELILIPGDGPVRIEKKEGAIEISGAPEMVQVLAENVRDFALEGDGSASSHIHIEYYPGHFFLDPSAEPVVVSLLRR